MAKQVDVEIPVSQAAAETAEDQAVINNAPKREFPGEWLSKASRIGNVPHARHERLRAMLAQKVEQIDMTTAQSGLSHGCFTASQA